MNSRERRLTARLAARQAIPKYVPEHNRLMQQEARLQPGLWGWRFYNKGRTIAQDPGLGLMRVDVSYSLKHCSGQGKQHVKRNATAKRFDASR